MTETNYEELITSKDNEIADLKEQIVCLQDVIDDIVAGMCDNVQDVLDFEEAYQVNVSDELFKEFEEIEALKGAVQ